MREEQGLTQLYVATSVGVTTDTISRWENKKYPSVKKENALRLAETLEVKLADILENNVSATQDTATDSHDSTAPDEYKNTEPAPVSTDIQPEHDRANGLKGQSRKLIIIAALLCLASAALVYWKNMNTTRITITAVRHLPEHAPPGSKFPVIISMSSLSGKKISLILTEQIPESAEITRAVPPWSASSTDRGKIKWIASTSRPNFTICYIAKINQNTQLDTTLIFKGIVTSSLVEKKIFPVKGRKILTTAPFHWADINSDGQIDDEEILRVFDDLGEFKGMEFGLKDIKKIWSSGGYRWDTIKRRYIPATREKKNEILHN